MKSNFVHRSSVHLWHRLSLNLLHAWMSFKFLFVASPGSYAKTFFWVFEKKIWDTNMGHGESQNFKNTTRSSLKSLLNLFKLFLNFVLSGSYKSAVWNFWNFEFLIFNEFFNFAIVPYRETNNLNYLQNELPYRETGVKFGSQGWVFSVYKALLTVTAPMQHSG